MSPRLAPTLLVSWRSPWVRAVGWHSQPSTQPSVALSASRLGSQSASAGNALPVTVNQTGTVSTSGDAAIGVLAQSIGGGGGYAAVVNAASATATNPGFMTIGSAGGSSGDGGDVTVTVSGSVTTTGTNAIGVFAQSVGGGGGAFMSVGLGELTPNFSAGEGDGGDVTVNINAPVNVSGTGSIGVLAQSVGGGGGLLRTEENFVVGSGQGTGAAGVVAINVNASVTVTGGTAIYAGSVKGDNDPYIYVAPGAVVSSSGGTAIVFDGALNQLENYGSVLVADPFNDRVVDILQSGQTTIVNYGLLTGQIDNRSELTFINAPGGTMGAGSALNNFGTLLVGPQGVVDTLDLPASLRNDAVGRIVFEVDALNTVQTSDKLNVRDTATIDGVVVMRAISLLPQQYSLLSAGTLALTAPVADTLIYDWTGSVSGNTLSATVTADFTPDGQRLTAVQGSKADYLQRVWDMGGANMAPVFGYLNQLGVSDLAQYKGILQQTVGSVLNSQAIEFKTKFNASLTESLSCPVVTSEGLRLQQTGCVWGKLTGNISEQSSNDSNSGYHVTAGGIRMGGIKALSSKWTAGFSLGYANNYLTATGFSSNGQFVDLSASLQRKLDAWTFGASLGFAQGWFQNNRSLNLPSDGTAQSLSGLYTSSSRMTMVGLKLRAAYTHDQGEYYVKPYVDLDMAYALQSGYSESGGGLLALKAESANQFNVSVTPMIELGADLATDGNRRIKAFVSAGASFLPNNNITTQMSLANLSTNVGTFGVTTDGPTVLGRLNVGIQAFESDNLEVRAQYGLQVGDGYWSQSLSANLLWRF
ncbi:MAG: autotransporter outer membrane beta-barrel domain-containing protein [Burkholderiaceae bacterium]|nr:autotransporter outer membrane beta-barrel domain-containing protein [Burkholderiaceae bacterium]